MSLWDLWLDNVRQAGYWRDTARSYFTMARMFRELGDDTHAAGLENSARVALDHGRRLIRFAKQNRALAVQFQRWP